MEYKLKSIISFCFFILFSLIFFVGQLFSAMPSNFTKDYLLILFIPSLIGFFLTIYFISFEYPEKRKRIVLGLNMIFLVVLFMVIRGRGELAILIIPSNVGIFFCVLIISFLISHFHQSLEKIKYSFVGFLIFFFMSSILDILIDKLGYFNNLDNFIKMVVNHTIATFFILLSHISLLVLIGINIYLNKRKVSESRKKLILLIIVPVSLIIILFLILGILYFLDSI